MAGGSVEPETHRDELCETCGLYYDRQGLSGHEETCEWPGEPVNDPEGSRDGLPPVEAADDAGAEHETAADGSGLGLSGPPSSGPTPDDEPEPSDADPDLDDAPPGVVCPECGADHPDTDPDEVDPDGRYRCDECRSLSAGEAYLR